MDLHKLESSYLEKCRISLNDEQTISLSESNHWEHVDRTKVHADWNELYKQVAPLIDASDPKDSHIQKLIEQHYKIACRFYTPSKEAYIGMALFYAENADMANYHNAYHPKMVEFLGNAMCVYAQEKL